jgi:hypothetical protein
MAVRTDLDRNLFESLCKGIRDITDEKLAQLHEMAGEAGVMLQSANGQPTKKHDGVPPTEANGFAILAYHHCAKGESRHRRRGYLS